MNNKGQGIGVLMLIFVAAIVGLTLIVPIANNVEQGTQAVKGLTTSTNYSITGIKDTKVALQGQELGAVTGVVNATSGATIPAANYTIAECIRPTDSMKGICYTALDDYTTGAIAASGPVKVTYTYYPDGYMDDSASRSMIGLVVLLSALALVVFVLVMAYKNLGMTE